MYPNPELFLDPIPTCNMYKTPLKNFIHYFLRYPDDKLKTNSIINVVEPVAGSNTVLVAVQQITTQIKHNCMSVNSS